jgi:putative ABC transport system permease protein
VRSGWGGASSLTVADAEAMGSECPSLAGVAWVRREVAQVIYADRNWSSAVLGASASFAAVRDWPLAAGAFFTERDEERAARVAVLGATVADELFGPGTDPLGAVIRIKNAPFEVVGVLERRGQNAWGQDQDDVVVLPFSTAERRVLGSGLPGAADLVFASAARGEDLAAATEEITALLRQRHRIAPAADPDFTVRSLDDMARAQESASRVLGLLLLCVASISLLVGGVGIMNVMLASVAERTREIGIRMAVGAKPRHILLQFLTEAVVLSCVGGFAGVLVGVGAARAVSAFAGWPTLISPLAAAGALAFSALVGAFFGLYPARRAARLDPIAALRWE